MTINDIHAKLAAINRTAGECLSYLYQVDASHKRLALGDCKNGLTRAGELDHQGQMIAKGVDHIKVLKALINGTQSELEQSVVTQAADIRDEDADLIKLIGEVKQLNEAIHADLKVVKGNMVTASPVKGDGSVSL